MRACSTVVSSPVARPGHHASIPSLKRQGHTDATKYLTANMRAGCGNSVGFWHRVASAGVLGGQVAVGRGERGLEAGRGRGSRPWSSRRQQLGQPDQVVGRGRQGELPADALHAAVPGAPLQGHLLDPAEPFLDPLADALADRVARMACRPAVDRRAAVAGVLGDVRRRVELLQAGDEALGVEVSCRRRP